MNTYKTITFEALTNTQLYNILRLRSDVFIVEQSAPYDDIDGLDPQALHICMLENETLIGYARILGPGLKFPEATMGRIVIAPTHRARGLGRQLITHTLSEIRHHYANPAILIEARIDLQPLYTTLGFTTLTAPYDWASVTYVQMRNPAA